MSTRGQPIYDWWSRHRSLFGLLYDVAFLGRETELRDRAVQSLSLESGEHVLELGCGPGNTFEALRTRVGSEGRVVGIDYSTGMTERAHAQVRDAEWQNVHVVRGDATRPGVEDRAFDAVYASMSLSAMPNPAGAISAAYDVLRPGGRMVVLDARPFQDRPWTLLNSLIVPLSEYTTNWFPDEDIPAALDSNFESVTVANFNGGTIFIATARREAEMTEESGSNRVE
jgi:demethylmenaquinone methyltransferase/2-methoxy-6-polyprenyl-1,4-benzoquinol methylase